MADLKNVSCPSCNQKYRLPDSIENRKVVCRGCQFAFSVPGVGAKDASDQAATEESVGSFDGAMFDSLDVDDLLNAKSSGLSQRRPGPVPSTEDAHNEDAAERRQQPKPDRADVSASKKSKDRKRNSARQKRESSTPRGEDPLVDARPAEQPSALPITVLDRSKKKSKGKKRKKKKKKDKSPTIDAEEPAESGDAYSDSLDERGKAVDAIDPEEQAVFDYARAVNGRKNALAVLVALAIAIGLGGWFSVQEIARLKAPLTQKERDILEDEGFRLKAAAVPRKGQFAALGRDVPRVGVAPGLRLDRLGLPDQKLPDNGLENKFDPNAAFGEQDKQRKPAKKEPPVDFDTRVAAGERASSFTVGKRTVLGPALAVSPRNVVFVPEGDGIASYNLVSKKQIDYKSVGRLAGKSDMVSALATTLDARFMVAGFRSGRVKLFQLDSQGRFYEITRLAQKHFLPIRQIAVSPDSQLVVTVDSEAQVAVWNVNTAQNKWKRKIEKPKEGRGVQRCLDIAFSSDGQQLLAALTDSDVVVNAGDGNPIARKDRPSRISAVLSPISRSSISCTETKISGFSLESDTELWKKSIRKTKSPVVALDVGGTTGLFFDGNKSIINFDFQTGELLGRMAPVDGTGHPTDSKPTVSIDGKYLLYGARNYSNGKLRINHVNRPNVEASELPGLPPTLELPARNIGELWVTKDGKRSRKLTSVSLPDSGKKISALTLNGDGLLFYSTESGGLHVYDWTNRIMLAELLIDSGKSISALAICGKWLAAGQKSGAILLYEIEASGSLKSHGAVFGHDKTVVGIESMPAGLKQGNQDPQDADSIASLSSDGKLRVWEIPTRGSLLNVETFREPPKSLVVLDDRTILVASTSHLATVNPDTQKVTVEGSRKGGSRVALSPDGKKLAFVNRKEITIAKTRTGVIGKPVPLDQNPGAIQFTRDSRMLQIDFAKHLAFVNYRTGKTVETIDAEIRTHSELETLFAVSSDETLMAAVAKNGRRIIIVPVEK